ncbi:SDR family NAD(P)-dependent oxidoreductase [Paenibacillus humicola]|uniref:SDR family NAD(P)-dependent oxidoreductase n=1 Tax=Paenibacillus humicola TaxID=3110540 RepID=UPI00237BB14E|nr:SDR family oxidoreductase [Paenibacillus humicola]
MLNNKIAVITGAGMGIGRAIALTYAQNGAHVVVNDIKEDALQETMELLGHIPGCRAYAHVGDISLKASVDELFQIVETEFGRIDILVNNAAWTTCGRHFLEYDEEFWDLVVRNNLKSVYLATHRAATMMASQEEGTIVNLSSIGATRAHRQMVAYDSCKGAIEAFTKATALDLAPWNIRINAISPASILGTPVKKMDESVLQRRDPADFASPILRQGTPEDIANAALFLASEQSSFMTGQTVAVDGGMSIQARPFARDAKPAVTPASWKANLKP